MVGGHVLSARRVNPTLRMERRIVTEYSLRVLLPDNGYVSGLTHILSVHLSVINIRCKITTFFCVAQHISAPFHKILARQGSGVILTRRMQQPSAHARLPWPDRLQRHFRCDTCRPDAHALLQAHLRAGGHLPLSPRNNGLPARSSG